MIEVQLFSSGRKHAQFLAAFLAIILSAGAIGNAAAQNPPPPPDQPQSQIPEKVAPPLENGAKEDKNGAKDNKFQREDGVIKPPGSIDPGIIEKPPETGGRMPVIPPPGSQGGNPSVHPK